MCYHMGMNSNQRTMTVIEAAQAIGVHPQTIRDWLKTGVLKGVKPGAAKSHWRIPVNEVQRLTTGGPDVAPAPFRAPGGLFIYEGDLDSVMTVRRRDGVGGVVTITRSGDRPGDLIWTTTGESVPDRVDQGVAHDTYHALPNARSYLRNAKEGPLKTS